MDATLPSSFAAEMKIAFLESQTLAEKAFAQISNEQLHVALHPETNSVR